MSSAPWPTRADLGGQAGHGRIKPEPEGALWHAPWEPRALALTLAAGAMGEWNIDKSRAMRETLPDYAQLSYYEIWVHALEKLLATHGLVSGEELGAALAHEAGHPVPSEARPLRPAGPVAAPSPPRPVRALRAAGVAAALRAGTPTARPAAGGTPRFALGQHVRTQAASVAHHTRLPAYARGKVGVVRAHHGRHVFADTHAQGLGEQPQWLYSVEFDGAALWGPTQPEAAGLTVRIDCWEPYLEACADAAVGAGDEGRA